MELFCCDLDNTLIYSYKRDIGEHKVLVETMENKELSFMTEKSNSLLEEIQKLVQFIPVTTRSLEQYNRISLSEKWKPQYALVANGGILLEDGKINQSWFEESKEIVELARKEMEKGIVLLQNDKDRNFEVRFINELFVFTKSNYPQETVKRLSEQLDLEKVSLHANGTAKVYIFPKNLNKGKAIQRIRKKFESKFIITAGDSDFDVPMILESDLGYFPPEILKFTSDLPQNSSRHVLIERVPFSDSLLENIKNVLVK